MPYKILCVVLVSLMMGGGRVEGGALTSSIGDDASVASKVGGKVVTVTSLGTKVTLVTAGHNLKYINEDITQDLNDLKNPSLSQKIKNFFKTTKTKEQEKDAIILAGIDKIVYATAPNTLKILAIRRWIQYLSWWKKLDFYQQGAILTLINQGKVGEALSQGAAMGKHL